MNVNADPKELEKFSELAHRWWDPESEFKPLHQINPIRLQWIESHTSLVNKSTIDVGCGGGILAESMAQRGAQVTGIDLSEKALKIAQLHSLESNISVTYQLTSAEDFSLTHAAQFDLVTCMEMLEHVPDPNSTVHACAELVKPGGWVFFSTLNRNFKSYLLAIIGAEYLLNMLPQGTHEYAKFIKPSELAASARHAQLDMIEIIGMQYNPVTQIYTLGTDTQVNYLLACRKKMYL